MTSKPSNGPAKVLSIESEEMVTFGSIHLGKEYFGLSVVLSFGPLLVPGLEAMLFAN